MIKEYRLEKGYTLEKLAEMCNISWRNLHRIENNPNVARLETIKNILKTLNVSDKDILKFMKEI